MEKTAKNEIQPHGPTSSVGHPYQEHTSLNRSLEEINEKNLDRPKQISTVQGFLSRPSEDQAISFRPQIDVATESSPIGLGLLQQANSNVDNEQNYGWNHDKPRPNENDRPIGILNSNNLLADEVDYLPSYASATSIPSAPPLSPEIYYQDRPEPIDVEEATVPIVLESEDEEFEDRLSSRPYKIYRKDVKKISVNVNLLTAVKRLLNMLKKVDKEKNLYSGKRVIAAIYRYEHIWLPIVANNKPELAITPPLDVYWVWIVHMLAPQSYYQDCINITGKFIPHRLITSKATEKSLELGKALWMKLYSSEPWELTDDHLSNPVYFNAASHISYNLKDAIGRQSTFYYQFSRKATGMEQ